VISKSKPYNKLNDALHAIDQVKRAPWHEMDIAAATVDVCFVGKAEIIWKHRHFRF
jgi:hypothetical protein